jgi:hypothetical protein
LTLACKFEGSEQPGIEREKEVNQIYVDTDLPAVELRVAQTMGTSDPTYFGFRNRKTRGMADDQIMLYFLGSKMSMAAMRMAYRCRSSLIAFSGAWSGHGPIKADRGLTDIGACLSLRQIVIS